MPPQQSFHACWDLNGVLLFHRPYVHCSGSCTELWNTTDMDEKLSHVQAKMRRTCSQHGFPSFCLKTKFFIEVGCGKSTVDFLECNYFYFRGSHQNWGWHFQKNHTWQWPILVVKMDTRNWGASSRLAMWRLSFGGWPKNPKRELIHTVMLLGWYFCRFFGFQVWVQGFITT